VVRLGRVYQLNLRPVPANGLFDGENRRWLTTGARGRGAQGVDPPRAPACIIMGMEQPPWRTPTRRFERFDVADCSVLIQKGGFLGMGKGKDIGGPILDMSDFGMRYAGMERLQIGANLTVLTRLVPIGRQMKIPVVVRWCSQDTRYPDRVIVGLEFIGMGEEHLGQIQKLREVMRKATAGS